MKANVPIHYIILDTIQKNLPKSPIIIILIHIFHSIGIIIPTQNILRLENSKFTVYKYTYNLLLFHLLEKYAHYYKTICLGICIFFCLIFILSFICYIKIITSKSITHFDQLILKYIYPFCIIFLSIVSQHIIKYLFIGIANLFTSQSTSKDSTYYHQINSLEFLSGVFIGIFNLIIIFFYIAYLFIIKILVFPKPEETNIYCTLYDIIMICIQGVYASENVFIVFQCKS